MQKVSELAALGILGYKRARLNYKAYNICSTAFYLLSPVSYPLSFIHSPAFSAAYRIAFII